MTDTVAVVERDDFEKWIADQQAAAVPSGEPDPGRGETIAEQNGCFACHSTDGSVLVGPTWLGLYGSDVELADGSIVIADEAFLAESILEPNATIVAGFPGGAMPPYPFPSKRW